MRELDGEPGKDGWPAEMSLSVSEDESFLMELLFIRAAWNLPAGDWLPAFVDPEPRIQTSEPAASDISSLTSTWNHWWNLGTDWLLRWEKRHSAIHSISGQPDPTTMMKLMPPRWTEVVYDEDFDNDGYLHWQASMEPQRKINLPGSPERRCIDALVPAWRAGLTVIMVLPFKGGFVQQIGRNGLLISSETYRNPQLLSPALSSFRRA